MDLATYRELFRNVKPPTPGQVEAFAQYVSGKHSWYKKLPWSRPGARFHVYLDPLSGLDTFQDGDGNTVHRVLVEGDPMWHYSMMPTPVYRERFGCQAVAAGYVPEVGLGGRQVPVPEAIADAGAVEVTAMLQPRIANPALWDRYLRFTDSAGDDGLVGTVRALMVERGESDDLREEIAALVAPERERQLAELRAAAGRVIGMVFPPA